MKQGYNFLKDLFTPEEFAAYEITLFPFNIKVLRDKLDEKLKEIPEYEVFAAVVYYKVERKLRNQGSAVFVQPYKWFISNKGNLLSLRRGESKDFLKTSINSGGYIQIATPSIKDKYKAENLVVHRILGCVFVPVKEELKGQHPKDLEVNHKNGIKTDISLGNLEWTTVSQNITHAYETGLMVSGEDHPETKPLKGKIIRGRFKEYEFVIFGKTELKKYGFDQAATSNAANGNLLSHGNCAWSFATEDETQTLPKGLTDEMVIDLKSISPNARFAYVGTHRETGEVLTLIGGKKKLKEAGFSQTGISNCISGLTTHHKNYIWIKQESE